MQNSHLQDRFNKAIKLEKIGDYPTALSEYIAILSEDKNFRNAYLNLGSLYYRMNKLSLAYVSYKKALRLGEDYINYFNIGCIFYKWGEFKRAIMNFEKAKQLNGNFALAIIVMGLSYSRLGNLKAAEKNFNEVIKIWPHSRVALTALAILQYNSENYNEAIIHINKLLQKDENNVKIKQLKTNILYKNGQIRECAEELKSLKKISDGYRFYDEYIKSIPVDVYTDKYGTIDEKIQFLEERSETDNDSLISLSLCHLFKGETDRALDYLFEAKERILN